ncbi:flagellar biosynthesis protein FliO [Rhodanobacter glycinis]|uniref:FliO/MopB family protein n=1 Tax=Rhodanobacter glycinis TaxID=582702 RepID=UPI001127C3F1|nr:flagellar biosynthetic protein FliO [Rhodanobacter glycinis]TPG46235.1 flagellar biosynthesis protein FliO [Rhodanobacter glycinis]
MSTFALMLAAAPAAAPEFNAAGELVRVVLSLLGIIGLILAAGWLTRRMQRRHGVAGRRIRCVESFAVGARDRLLLLDADGKRLLIGMGPGGMRTLHVYDGTQAAPVEQPAAAPVPAFGDLLARWKRGA